jgi:predicted ATPase
MERAAGFTHNDTPAGKLDKLDAVLTLSSTEDKALFAELLSLPNDGRYPAVALTPQQRRQKTMEVLGSQMEALARQNPVLMIFEDAHWTDPTSLELFGRAVDQVASLRVLLIVTSRPEFAAPWIGRPHVTALTLNRLTQRDIDALIDRVVGNKQLPANVRQDIMERTDGVPLFVEEMTKAVLEAEGEGDARRTAAAVPSPALAVPASLHASLMARLDRLGPAKEVAQVGAAIGCEFSHALLAAIVRKPEADLDSALDRLVDSDLLFRQGVPPHASYLFKHALVQDAAYGTLLGEPRRALHTRIAEALENQFAEIAENQPELLARHYTEAGQIEKSVGLWGKAGQRSLARSALVEAVEQVTRALGQIETLPSTPALRREQINLQVALISALFHVKGPAAAETKAAVERASALIEHAEKLGEQPQDPLLLFSVLYGGWVANYVAFNGDLMRTLAAQFLALAEKQASVVPLMIGHRMAGISSVFAGQLAEGRTHYDQALALYDPVEHPPLAPRFGQDNKSSVLSYRAFALWLLGYPDAAQAEANHALDYARHVGHAGTIMNTLSLVPIVPFLCGDNAATEGQLDELIALAEEKNALFWKMFAVLGKGGLLAATGKGVEAIQIIISGMKVFRSTGSTMFEPWWLHHLGWAHARLGALDDASRCLDEALTMVETRKDRWCEPELHRIAGEIALKSPKRDVAKAQVYFERALAVARAQQAKSWELRAATSLARLWRDQGKVQQARELMAPVYGWFTEGFDTRDLKEAAALLNELQ